MGETEDIVKTIISELQDISCYDVFGQSISDREHEIFIGTLRKAIEVVKDAAENTGADV